MVPLLHSLSGRVLPPVGHFVGSLGNAPIRPISPGVWVLGDKSLSCHTQCTSQEIRFTRMAKSCGHSLQRPAGRKAHRLPRRVLDLLVVNEAIARAFGNRFPSR